MRVVDNAILATLADAGLRVFDGVVPVDDQDARVVTTTLPYVVFYSSLGDDDNPRLSGDRGRRSVFFQITYIGGTREQAKWAGEKQRAALSNKKFTITGVKCWPVHIEESQRVFRDDDAVQPDGGAVFYGVDLYAVSITTQ